MANPPIPRPQKRPFPKYDSDFQLIHDSFGPPKCITPNGISIASAVFVRDHDRDQQTDRHTNRRTTSQNLLTYRLRRGLIISTVIQRSSYLQVLVDNILYAVYPSEN